MSKFASKLQRIYRTPASSVGFRKSDSEAESPSLLLVADLTKADVKKAKGIIDSGIDAIILSSGGLDTETFERLVSSAGDIPLGLLIESTSREKIADFVESGCDFIIFDLLTPLEVVNKEGLGKILKIDPSLAPGLVRSINELTLPVDGVFVAGEDAAVTIEHLLTCQFFAELLNEPLLTNVSSSVTSSELSSLRGAGVTGLISPQGLSGKAFVELRKKISSLPKTAKRKAGPGALLPHVGTELETEVEEEEV